MKWILSVLIVVSLYNNTFAKDIFVGGAGASDNNPGSATQPFATIQKAASVAVAGDVIKIRSGTYRETIVPNSGTIFQPDAGATVIISGLNVVDNAGWTVHSGQIYKKSITLPVNGYQQTLSSNTTIVANQIFKDGSMMFEARWPKISRESDLMDQHKWRSAHLGTNTVLNTAPQKTGYSFQPGSITDAGLGAIPNLTGAKLFINGWFGSATRTVNSHSGNQITFNGYFNLEEHNQNFRKWWYVTNKLGLLTDEKEWHYENGTLYFRQPGGGSPTGVEFKARNWGFDLRGKSGVTIAGIRFIGCEVATGNTNTNNCVVDNIRARFTNHFVMQETGALYWDITRFQSGLRLLGSNNVVKNSEFDYGSSQCIWMGANGKALNNKISNYGYDGNYGAGVGVLGNVGNVEIAHCTIFSMGRSAIDFGPNPYGTKFNLNIHHNDLSDYGKLNHDVGAIYTGNHTNTTGTVIHHNWIHDSGAKASPTGHRIYGIQAAIYFDQGSGPATFHHNVCWRNFENMLHAADFYILSRYQNRQDTPSSMLYNNTFASEVPYSYVTYFTDPLDIQRNNIYKKRLVFNWGASTGNVAYSLMENVDPMYVGTGQGGLAYRLRAGSPGINTGVVIPGITDGSVGAPDIGAYEFGGTDWVPGYTAVPQTTPTNTPPGGSITAPANNTSFVQGAQINITATASDANGSVARVEFFDGTTKLGEDTSSPYSFAWPNAAAGTHTLTVRITDNENATATSTPVTITVTANASPTVSITAPANNAQVTAGTPISITATAADANGSVTKVEFFDGTTKLGEDLSSPYTFAWNNATAGAHVLTAKATDDQTNVTTSSAVNITVTAGNTPPTVSITSPTNNAQIASGSPITITATAADANGSVTKVEFFSGTTKLGEDLTSPYTFAWNNAADGTHDLTAKATDNGGLVTTSTVVKITLKAGNIHPSVRLTKPGNNARFALGSTIDLTATASDADGSVTKVEFFSGTTKLGEDLTSPYSLLWNSATPGTYSLTAKATDNGALVTTSTALNVIVDPAVNTPPVVTITAPANNAQFAPGSPITLTATASDPNGTVTKVEFFDGTTKLGEDLTSPYSFVWSNAAAGTHVVTVKATDNGNVVTTSAAIIITLTTSTNTLPAVSITAPLNNAEFMSGSAITITATASDANGSVAKVEFFNGATKIGEDLTSPYSFIWTNVASGNHALSARATDNLGAIASSSTINISVTDPGAPTVEAGEDVSLTLPENSTTLAPSVTSDLPVEYSWTQIEGPNTASMSDPGAETINVSDLIEGTYVFELLVTNSNGVTSTDQITVTVVAGVASATATQSGIPRFFSPNDDGTGDYWEWQEPETFENSQLTVLSRSGQKVFEAMSYNNTWDGKMDGEPLQAGDYYYVIKMSDLTELRGAVRILR